MRCENGHEQAAGMRFCTMCGAAMQSAPTAPTPPAPSAASAAGSGSGRMCTNGHHMPAATRFCLVCGAAPTTGVPPVARPGATSSQASGMTPPAYGAGGGFAAAPPPPAYLPPAKRGLPVWAIVGITLGGVAMLGLVGFGFSKASNPMQDLTVELTVYSSDACDLPLGYWDVPGSGVTVIVDDQIVARDMLPSTGDPLYGVSCTFSVNVGPVPADGVDYVLQIGDRGSVDSTQSELADNDWVFSASLGA